MWGWRDAPLLPRGGTLDLAAMRLRNLLPERIIHRVFEIGVIIKGVDGCLETLGGVLL